jgi:hypothetical protein
MTTRRWIIAVGIVASLLGATLAFQRRQRRFRELRRQHQIRAWELEGRLKSGAIRGRERRGRAIRLMNWNQQLAAKYDRAARSPWLPVPSDPPPE